MDDETIKISDFISGPYKNYAKYTLFHRAIPSVIDGLKDSQRKAFYCMQSEQGKIKVMSLAGIMIFKGNYAHGDGPACQLISSMAQDFTGSNNLPYFLRKGNFGNKFVKTPSAPRYIYVKNNPIFKKIFLDRMLEKTDLENPEPKYFLPILPTILINGVEGVAVGFATKILPYNIQDIKEYIMAYMAKSELPTLKPYYKNYSGKIELDKVSNKWEMFGKYEIVNTTTIKVTEIPVQMDRVKYFSHLRKLQDQDLIKGFVDKSRSSWNTVIKVKRDSIVFDDPIKYLKLKQILSENLTTIDEDQNLRVFDNVYALLNYFIEFRLKIYTERKIWKIENLNSDIELFYQKIKFIGIINSLNLKKLSYKEIVEAVKEKMSVTDDNLKRLMGLKTFNLNSDYIIGLKEKIEEAKKELKFYQKVSQRELYETDLAKI